MIKFRVWSDMRGHTHSHSHSHSHDVAKADRDSASVKKRKRYRPTDFDMEKLRSTIKQFVRDWSEEVHIQLCALRCQ
jgi:carnosine N-methyltransferase